MHYLFQILLVHPSGCKAKS